MLPRIATGLLLLWPMLAHGQAVFRPYDLYHTGPACAGTGATRLHSGSVSCLPMQPAKAADLQSSEISMGIDAQTRIAGLQTQANLEPQFIPVIAWARPMGSSSAWGFTGFTPFQRKFPDERFLVYAAEIVYGRIVTRNLNLGITAGISTGYQVTQLSRISPSGSVALLGHFRLFDAGLYYRFPTRIESARFQGVGQRETIPSVMSLSFRRDFGVRRDYSLFADLEYINWSQASLVTGGQNTLPSGLRPAHSVHPHAGLEWRASWWPGLKLRNGFYTADFFDFTGRSERQYLVTFGLGGLAASDVWGDRLSLDFSLVSSFLSSFVYEKSNKIESLQATLTFRL